MPRGLELTDAGKVAWSGGALIYIGLIQLSEGPEFATRVARRAAKVAAATEGRVTVFDIYTAECREYRGGADDE